MDKLDAAIRDQLLRRNGEVLAYILALPKQPAEDQQIDAMVNEGGKDYWYFQDFDDYRNF